jgi:flagellar basal body rod protein FlgG
MAVAQLKAENDIKLKAMDKSGELVEYDELGRQQASAVIQNTLEQSNMAIQQNMAGVIQAIQASNEQQTQALAGMLAQLTKPKQVVRDANGKIVGVQ